MLGTEVVKVAVNAEELGRKVAAPITQSWTIAQGTLRGTVYHETYSSPLAGSVGIMRIQVGATQPAVFKSGCGNVCHSASADGSSPPRRRHLDHRECQLRLEGRRSARSCPVGRLVRLRRTIPRRHAAHVVDELPRRIQHHIAALRYEDGDDDPRLGVGRRHHEGGDHRLLPDGKHIAFVHEDKDNGRTVAMMDFDVGTKTFSNPVDSATDPNHYLAWPAFTPDGKAVVYHAGSSATFQAGYGTAADLFIVDVATRTVQRLDALDGYTGSGSAVLTCPPTTRR